MNREKARALLTYAFASDLIDSVKIEVVRKVIGKLLFEKLPREYALTDA